MSSATAASQNLHDRLFYRMLHAPATTFFDVVPFGRVLNRFSHDLDQVDLFLPSLLHECSLNIFNFIGIVVLAIVVTYYFIVALVPIVIFFVYVQNYFTIW